MTQRAERIRIPLDKPGEGRARRALPGVTLLLDRASAAAGRQRHDRGAAVGSG